MRYCRTPAFQVLRGVTVKLVPEVDEREVDERVL